MFYALHANKKPTRRERDDASNTRKCICHILFICLPLFTGYRFEIGSSFHNLNLRKIFVVKVQRATKRYYVVNVYCLPEKERVRNELFFINELY